jgi:hypothetical protein
MRARLSPSPLLRAPVGGNDHRCRIGQSYPAGFEDPVSLHFHELRGTTVTLLSESGCTPQQIAIITGHSLKTVHRILERYLARTRGLVEQAIFNWENSERTKFANQLQTSTSAPTETRGKNNAG